MKNKLIVTVLLIAVMSLLIGCQSNRPKFTSTDMQQLSSEVSQFIMDHQLDYDDQGNSLGYTVRPNGSKILVNMPIVTEKTKKAIKDQFGKLVEVAESDEMPQPHLVTK